MHGKGDETERETMPSTKEGGAQAKDDGARRGGGLKRLPEMMTRVLDPVARRRGLAGAALLADWAAIVGPALAARAQPVKLGRDFEGSGGVLHLRVSGPAALELQHAGPQIVERINTHLGYPAVAGLRLVQVPVSRPLRSPAPPPRELSGAAADRIEAAVAHVDDAGLRSALAGLGRSLVTRAEADATSSARSASVNPD